MSLSAQVYTNRRGDADKVPRSLHRVARQSREMDVRRLTQQGQKAVFSQRNVCERGGVVLGFALQEAARAAQVLAALTSFRSCLRLEYVLGEAYLSKRFCTGRARKYYCGTKGTTNP